MEKSDLRTGMLCILRNGEKSLVMLNTSNGDILAGSDGEEGQCWFPLDGLNDDLTKASGQSKYDVMFIYDYHANDMKASFSTSKRILLWERKEEKPILTLDGVEYSESTLRNLIKMATQ
jgi:hypothetical protein